MKKNALENTKKSKITIVVIGLFFLLLFGCLVMSLYIYNGTSTTLKYFNNESISSIYYEVANQEAINKRLNSIANDNSYTMDNAYVELNPYKISPLSAIIIFHTKQDEQIRVYINNVYMTTMESSKKHVIPIYGLYEDKDNIVRLEGAKEVKEYTIKTEKSNIEYPLEVEVNKVKHDDLYFTVASYATYLTGWDKDGNLRFYLTENNRMDVEWLPNGHFIIGVAQGQFAENFLGFVEMDYLGKIYNYYTMENGFSFESQILSNGNIMSAGGNKAVYVTDQVVYEMDPRTGNKVSEVNISDIILGIDSNFDKVYLGQKAIRNGFYYNEETNEMILSFRGWDTVFSINYKTKELNWIFTDPNNELFKNSVWDEYKVELKSGRYPLGQHSPKITEEGYIAFFNNGYNRLHGFENGGEDRQVKYLNNYSSGEIYKIENKEATLVWNYDASKKLFSHQYGSISIDNNNNKLINFGYNAYDTYRNNSEGLLSISEKSPEHIYAEIIELDNNYNVLFKAKSEEGKYRAFKHGLYNEVTSNTTLNTLNRYNNIPNDSLKESSYRKINLDESIEWINTIEFTENTLTTDYIFNKGDNVDIYLVTRAGKIYILNYLDQSSTHTARIFKINIPSGEYALFIKVNDTLYNTNKSYKF